MLASRWVFSITLAASATFRLGALWVPAVMMRRYRASTNSAASGVEPEVTLIMVIRRRCRSPGLMRSGLQRRPQVYREQARSHHPAFVGDGMDVPLSFSR